MGAKRTCSYDEAGWTLLEVMAVVMILGILVGIAVGSFQVSADRSKRVTCEADQRILASAVVAYQQEHAGSLPPDIAAIRPYVGGRTAYDVCPGDPSVAYVYEATNGRITCPLHTTR
ncbi:MAG TPA: type II secretion system protein [Coriobacteriia bacterium]